ncbi:MAG: ribulose-phosphate 3-epimerase [Butyrivibrio sp.]|nr:ribulose-phosphate 3-epimerase [Butyrivibrio sp.]
MMNLLSPSILSADFTILGQQIEEADRAGAQYIHIDVMDGIFVPSISYGMPVIKSIRKATDKVFDVHLMIKDPIRYIEEFAEIGADIITFHLEAAPDVNAVIEKIRACGKKVGLSIKPGTPVEELVPYLDKVDMILVMTVEPGFGGQSIIPESFDRVRAVRKMLDDRKLDTDIQVDGGICTGNVKSILEAGANVVVAGSAVFKGNISENVKGFLDIMQ